MNQPVKRKRGRPPLTDAQRAERDRLWAYGKPKKSVGKSVESIVFDDVDESVLKMEEREAQRLRAKSSYRPPSNWSPEGHCAADDPNRGGRKSMHGNRYQQPIRTGDIPSAEDYADGLKAWQESHADAGSTNEISAEEEMEDPSKDVEQVLTIKCGDGRGSVIEHRITNSDFIERLSEVLNNSETTTLRTSGLEISFSQTETFK